MTTERYLAIYRQEVAHGRQWSREAAARGDRAKAFFYLGYMARFRQAIAALKARP